MLQGRTGSKAKTLELLHLQPPEVGACNEPPYGTRVVDHGTDELLVHQDPISDRENNSPIQERTHNPILTAAFSVGRGDIKKKENNKERKTLCKIEKEREKKTLDS